MEPMVLFPTMQLQELKQEIDALQLKHGSAELFAIYGAGHINKPDIMFIFMNPTAKNISADKTWSGLRAPWLGTKNVWRLFFKFGLLPEDTFNLTQSLQPSGWDAQFAERVYTEISSRKIYITNLAKCTQIDARHVADSIFRQYLDNTKKEISLVRPKKIITFGNQVSSVLMGRPITVSKYRGTQKETLAIGEELWDVYPIYYPVGQGQRNLPLAIKRIKAILNE